MMPHFESLNEHETFYLMQSLCTGILKFTVILYCNLFDATLSFGILLKNENPFN